MSADGVEREAPESYPDTSLEDLREAAVDRYREAQEKWGEGDDWADCAPEDLRARARENLVGDHVNDEDYADALNYLVMAREAMVRQELRGANAPEVEE